MGRRRDQNKLQEWGGRAINVDGASDAGTAMPQHNFEGQLAFLCFDLQ